MLLSLLLNAAPAANETGNTGNPWMSWVMIGALVVIFYLFMIRPQSQRQKKIKEFRNSIKKGDHVMTAGGIYGRIKEVKDTYFVLQISEGVNIKIDKTSVYQSMSDVAETGASPQNENK